MEIPNLYAIPSGPVPPNPAELIGSRAMRAVLQEVREGFDLVIVDAPPVVAVADASILSTMVDGVLFTLAAGDVTREVAQHAKTMLEQANANLLGVDFNRSDPSDKKSYQYNYYYSSDAETDDD